MIKFVCSGCGERLSVPDQHGGRKGVCPTCQVVNHIPLKGYAETQGGTSPRVKAAAKPAVETENHPISEPAKPQAPESKPDVFESIRKYREEAEKAGAADEPVRLEKEKRLPKPVKIALLIVAVLVLCGALYFALYFAVHAFLKAAQ